jgi:hypothetical protein
MPPPRSWARPGRRCARPSAATASAYRPTTEAVRQRAVAAASQRGSPPAAPPLDPVFAALNQGQLPARRGPHAEQGVRLRRAEEIETLSYRTVVELNAESRLAPERRVATIARRPERARRLAEERAGRPSGASSSASPAPTTATDSTPRPRSGGGGRCPIGQPCPSRLATRARPGSALIWPPNLNSMFLHEPAELLGELPEPTRVALIARAVRTRPRLGQAPRGLAAAPALVTAGAAGRPPVRPPAPVARAAAALAGRGRPGG